jgi:RNA polymerase sigma-70 factor (ECF subfamily)
MGHNLYGLMDEMADNSEPLARGSLAGSSPESADSELVTRARAGDEAAFEQLFSRHKKRVALIASRFFKSGEQVEEIVQESFMKAYFALESFSSQQETAFASWLARIAFNVCYDELRRTQRRPENRASDLSEEDTTSLRERMAALAAPAQEAEAALIDRDLAAKLLSRLKPEDRLVLVMLDVEELSVAEAAELTGWSVSKVKVRAHRARSHLRRVLSKLV